MNRANRPFINGMDGSECMWWGEELKLNVNVEIFLSIYIIIEVVELVS